MVNLNAQNCVAGSGNNMSPLNIFKVELIMVKGRKFTHTVNDINKLNDNIIGIDLYMATN